MFYAIAAATGLPAPVTTLPEQLRAIRKRAGLTQTQLALKLGWSSKRVSNFEQGVRPPGLDALEAWARACRHDLRVDFLPMESGPTRPRAALDEVITLVEEGRGASPEAIEALRRHVEAWSMLAGGR